VEPRIEVLERARPRVVEPGLVVRGRRTLVEDPLGRAFPLREALVKHVVTLPARQDPLLERDQIEVAVDSVEGHAMSVSCRCRATVADWTPK
jgi:hypothetical protein